MGVVTSANKLYTCLFVIKLEKFYYIDIICSMLYTHEKYLCTILNIRIYPFFSCLQCM